MGKTSGCVLILAGLAVGSYALYPDFRSALQASAKLAAEHDGPAGVRDSAAAFMHAVLKVAGAPLPGGDKPAPDPSQQVPRAAPKSVSEPVKGETGAPVQLDKKGPSAPGVVPPPDLVPPVPVPAKRPRAAVVSVQVNEAPPRVPVGDAKAEPPPEGAVLARQIQVQLKRVGCYRGDVTDVWTPAVRQAMRDFTERANASLPVNEPDPVLLAMLQSHAPGTCSDVCPHGQERAASGRCVPSVLAGLKDGGKAIARERAVVKAASGAKGDVAASKDGSIKGTKAAKASAPAGAGKRRASVAGGAAPEETINGSAAGPEGRMSLAGPTAADAPVARRPQAGARRQSRSAGVHRSDRSRRAYRPSYGKGYTTGLPSWALPFFLQ
jgi:hypothetical protein